MELARFFSVQASEGAAKPRGYENERRSREGIGAGFLISPAPIPWQLRGSLAWLLGLKKPPTKQATSGLSPFSNKDYEMAPAVDRPFLSRFICSYYGKTYLPIGCFGDVIDN